MADRRFSDDEGSQRRFLLGVGFDEDGHARVTKSEEFFLVGGSEETHAHMRECVERFTDTLRRMGTDLDSASDDDLAEAADEAGLTGDDD